MENLKSSKDWAKYSKLAPGQGNCDSEKTSNSDSEGDKNDEEEHQSESQASGAVKAGEISDMTTFVQKRRGPKISKLKSILEQYENEKEVKQAPQILKQNKREARLVMDIDDVAERLHTATR